IFFVYPLFASKMAFLFDPVNRAADKSLKLGFFVIFPLKCTGNPYDPYGFKWFQDIFDLVILGLQGVHVPKVNKKSPNSEAGSYFGLLDSNTLMISGSSGSFLGEKCAMSSPFSSKIYFWKFQVTEEFSFPFKFLWVSHW